MKKPLLNNKEFKSFSSSSRHFIPENKEIPVRQLTREDEMLKRREAGEKILKRLTFVFVMCFAMYSCTVENKNDLTPLLHKIDSLETCMRILNHKNDSLSKIAVRWKYGRDTYLYEDDFQGGSTMSWRWFRSREQLKFDPDLLDKIEAAKSEKSSHTWANVSVNELVDNLDMPKSQRVDYVNAAFEADRFNYYITVLQANAYNEAIYRIAYKWAERGKTCNANFDYVAKTYAGLLYRHLYNEGKKHDDDMIEAISKELEYQIRGVLMR